ncbi:aminomethyl-transferring glycine dehydrogenase subunit GcvPB [Desulfosporosinus sp. BICA1-9]|uniref:aminomethyl-transferring glycine dehydrogenase subunit GcvPB n=1 Tax=Desulfosporosinus sp. BICA1-9 TaxID=1531958 RepID=UPI00054BCDE3|nr:aminomethyl-transferring glycine dehydrogenase subunit GcvPB [Desulfosporosinus sp. BICA1-9]KJS48574.1 MAG: glycine dehydrogenase [Peptococcaceae bacterium BRH_c23]KJS89757.1 MAG: glycine dehydrogenase [Desulfosporosinus sp. BICA1-9]HBW38124.1 glycine dehydrogenase (aminomethyl-transferring) [Desulfosporosinus sp.]
MKMEPLIFEQSAEGRCAMSLPVCDVPEVDLDTILPSQLLRDSKPELPQLAEVDLVRHFTRLSSFNHGVDTGFYPLGSCTMKYNPKVNESLARLSDFTDIHPYQPEQLTQGSLQLMYELQQDLCEITGMDAFTLQPAAGAHGEMTGILMIKAYHESRQDTKRTKIIVPDAAHGTNPATASMAGFNIIQVPSNERGGVDIEALRKVANEEVAGLMLTNPNTLGLFDENILEIAEIIHSVGGLLYYDGANTNAIMGITRPGDMGFDAVHINLHKTFSTPHGGGGPGAGPVGVKEFLEPFLPKPVVEKREDRTFTLNYNPPQSIGRVKTFYSNFSVLVKAYAYIRGLGGEGLKNATQNAVLNANYLMSILKEHYYLPYDRTCKHEFVITSKNLTQYGIHTLDIAKRLLDYGYHPPTIYFPLVVEEAMMIEPTESESLETLDQFVEVMIKIAEEAKRDSELVKTAPHNTLITRLDETAAARKPNLRWKKE